jgi:hypothetical protein
MKDAIMRDRLGDLIKRYYPSEAAPLGTSLSYHLRRMEEIRGVGLMIDIVLPVIYEESSSMWQSSADGWVTTTLLEAGVGLRDVWETVAGLYERVSIFPLGSDSADELGRRRSRVLRGGSGSCFRLLAQGEDIDSSC